MDLQDAESVRQAHAGRGAADECAAIAADLERLKTMIADAGDKLLVSFNEVGAVVPQLDGASEDRQRLGAAVAHAVTALQFQDMATQLTAHAQRRLAALQDYLRSLSRDAAVQLAFGHAQAQPVDQAEMSVGSIELF